MPFAVQVIEGLNSAVRASIPRHAQ